MRRVFQVLNNGRIKIAKNRFGGDRPSYPHDERDNPRQKSIDEAHRKEMLAYQHAQDDDRYETTDDQVLDNSRHEPIHEQGQDEGRYLPALNRRGGYQLIHRDDRHHIFLSVRNGRIAAAHIRPAEPRYRRGRYNRKQNYR